MAYTKTNWKNSPDTSSPITAANLNKIENGIEEAHNVIDASVPYGMPLVLEWEQGRLSTQGVEVASNNACRTQLIQVNAGDELAIIQPPNLGVDMFFYNGNTFVERIPWYTGSTAKVGTRIFTVPVGANGFRSVLQLSTPITPDVVEKIVFASIVDHALIGILDGIQDGVHRYAKLRSFGNQILTGTLYPNGSISRITSYDNAPYGGVAIGLGIEQKNVEHTLLSSTGLLYDAGNGSFLTNIKQTDISAYDYLLTHLWTGDMSNFPMGSVETSAANDGTIVGGVLELLNYVRTTNSLCNVILVSVPPVAVNSAGENIFNAKYANDFSIKELDNIMHILADKYHFTYIDWQDMYLSYHYQEYTYQANNIQLASDAPYRIMAEYLSGKVRNSFLKENDWVNGVYTKAFWEQGRISTTGEQIASTNNIRTRRIPVADISRLYVNVTDCICSIYYFNNDFVSYESNKVTPATIDIPSGVSYARIVVKRKGGADITPDFGDNVIIYNYDGEIMRAVVSCANDEYTQPLLTIIDDDSNERFYSDLYQVFKNKNVPISTAVITGRVGNNGYMTWDEIEECYANGIEILSHSNRHFLATDPDFETITVNEIQKDYQKAKNILGMHGVNSDLLVFSGSTGRYAKFQTAGQRVYDGGFLAGTNEINYQGVNPYEIQRYRIGNQTDYHCDLDVLKGLIDTLKEDGGWMVWMTHTSGGAEAWDPGTGEGSSAYILGQAIDYAVSQEIPVVTAEYGFKKYCKEV